MNVKTTTDSVTQSKHGLVCDKSTSDNSNDYTVPIELFQLHHCMAMSQSGEERTPPVSVTCCYVWFLHVVTVFIAQSVLNTTSLNESQVNQSSVNITLPLEVVCGVASQSLLMCRPTLSYKENYLVHVKFLIRLTYQKTMFIIHCCNLVRTGSAMKDNDMIISFATSLVFLYHILAQ